MRLALSVLLLVHGLIHLLGFVKAFGLAPVDQLEREISRPAGLLWLLTAALFTGAAVLLVLRKDSWAFAAAPAVIASQVLIALSWSDAKFGTLANVAVALALVPALAEMLPSSFSRQYAKAVDETLARSAQMPLLTEADLAPLPAPVQRYVRASGAVGKPKVRNFRASFTGTFKLGKDKGWMEITAEQYNFFDEPARFFLIKSSMFGIPFDGLHIFEGPSATMRIRLASLLQVVEAKGPKMNQGETVTVFNDMCVLAPATLIDRRIQWEAVDDLTAKASFTHRGVTIGAVLKFNRAGELVDFYSDDRVASADGKTYESHRWSTPVREYRDFGGRRVMTEGEAIWHRPDGEFPYARFTLRDIEYNCTARH